ncbi:FliH/SctL family protein [Anaerotignum sp. MB30-C6]|uniref:FliH/SctL family protein n=1 Tax=Anaerotignum sp. MB30-C6 TaxID=3070814 RepID=UPI0027DD440D|nr:FliH/SctL family protein [Anaerotignum sp. MB30-C6]WMI81434.1 FliH/SctL family protein [Anaerotignum sp. MB30-C6]
MILLHSDESTVGSFPFAQFGAEVEEKEHTCQRGCEIVLPDFTNEVIEEVEIELEEPQEECPPEPIENSLLLIELEKREAELLAKEEKILAEAQKKADDMIKQAQQDAEEIKEKAFNQGSQEGYQDGYEKAYEEHKAETDEETAVFLLQARDIIQAFEEEKELLLSQNIDELKELAIAVAEKVIHVSLKTSGEIIKKMIVTATNKMKYKEWVKIYISKSDSSLIVQSNADLLDALSHVSEHIKVIVMEDSAPGTCIIELPDQIIDASASTQIENIRGIMKSVGTRRE